MKKNSLIVWSALSASIALIAVFSIFAQAVRSPDPDSQPVLPQEDPSVATNPVNYVAATSEPRPVVVVSESNALQEAAGLETSSATSSAVIAHS